MSARHLPEIDGLRAIAAISVVAFHAQLTYVGGGFLGVDVFFVLSGYLTTSLGLSGRYTFNDFMVRRARRIWPLLLFISLVVGAIAAIAGEGNGHRLLTGALFLENLLQSSLGPEGPMSHTWTLGAEMQFYAAIALLSLSLPRRAFRLIVIAAFFASTALRVENAEARDWWGGYCGPFAHSSGLFLGAALATFPLERTPAGGPILAVSLATICYAFAFADFRTVTALTVWITVVELASAGAIAAIVAGTGQFGRLLRSGPMRRLGLLSYGIYLWHYPISYMLRDQIGAELVFSLTLTASVILSAASYWLIEARNMSTRAEQSAASARSGPTD